MASGKNRINFFISMDTVMAYLEKHVVDQAVSPDTVYFDCAFTADVIEGPFRLFYRGSPEKVEFEIDTRFSLYQVEEEESRRKARAVLNREGEVNGEAPEEVRGLLQGYLAFCTSFSSYLKEHGIFDRYGDLDPEQEGILVEFSGDDLDLRHVSGNDRPDLVCQTLSGETKLMRPYSSDFMKSTLLGMMDAETKEKAAEAGDVDMMHHLFEYYMGNVETPQNDLNHMMKLMKTLGTVLGKETEIPEEEEEQDSRNPEKAFYWLKKIAETGDAGAMNALSIFYTKGFGTERDFRKAAEWRKKAADHGLEAAEGQKEMLLMIAEMKEQAEAGNTEAQAKYAGILALLAQDNTELGSDADNAEAFQWAQKSAAKFDLNGIFTLARFYADGTGTVKDDVKALRLFERAAGKGHAPSQARLGQMYFQGEGTEENPKAAFEWSRKAAEAGDMNGMDNLAACYLLGKGVDQNPGKAVEWLQKAAELGDESAKGLLEKLGAPLKPQLNEERQPQTLEEAEQMAEQGSVSAMKLLANYYINRPGGREDLYEAQKWAKMAADHGDTEIQSLLEKLNANLNGELTSFEDARTAAEAGNPSAQQLLGTYYAIGHETEINLTKALYWNRKAAAGGVADAQEFVDYFNGIDELEQKAAQGDGQAEADLAGKYIAAGRKYDNASEKLFAEALKLAKASTAKGNPHGMFMLGLCNENGYGMEQNPEEAFRLYKQSAEAGDPDGQCELSHAYMQGVGTDPNQSEAFRWATSSADLGNGRALMNLATFYELGIGGVTADYEEAVRLVQKAVEKDVPDAKRELGLLTSPDGMLLVGKTILGLDPQFGESDKKQAARLIKRAAEGGNGEAQYLMGMLYLNAIGVEHDYENAVEWFRKGAESGNEDAANNLVQYDRPEAYNAAANMEFAKKDQADKEKVFRLMKHAAEGGLAASQSTLGFLYMNGYGVLPDYQKGMEWFRKAADQGNENAIRNIQKYESPDGLFMGAMASFAANRKAGLSDGTAAYELLKKAVEAGSPEAMNLMGVFLADPTKMASQFGVTVDKNCEKAAALFQRALELKPEFAHAEKNQKKLADLEEAEKTGREPDADLKWSIALKKMNSGANLNKQPADRVVSSKETAQNSRDSSEIENRQKEEKPISEESKPDQEALSRNYQENGKCRYCGGDFKKGLFGMKCTRCGKKKDY